MKPLQYIITASLMWLAVSCAPNGVEQNVCNCPAPYDPAPGFGVRIPPIADVKPMLSPDGRTLAFLKGDGNSVYLLDLVTLRQESVNFSPAPNKIIAGISNIAWCASDGSRLAFVASELVHIGSRNVFTRDLYLYNTQTHETQTGTPAFYGPYGDTTGGLALLLWPGQIGKFRDAIEFETGYGGELYDLTTGDTALLEPAIIAMSPDGKHRLTRLISAQNLQPHYECDGSAVAFPPYVDRFEKITFAPHGDRFVVSGTPNTVASPYPKLWMYSSTGSTSPLEAIDFQQAFCTYSFWGIWPEFLTDSTLAVSMHKDGDTISPLWEVSLSGKRIRQLTSD